MSNPVIERLRALCVETPPHDPGQGLRDVFELHECGVLFERSRLGRLHPEWSEDQISAAVRAWLRDDPLPFEHLGGFRRISGEAWLSR